METSSIEDADKVIAKSFSGEIRKDSQKRAHISSNDYKNKQNINHSAFLV